MTLPLPNQQVADVQVKQNFDELSKHFPIQPADTARGPYCSVYNNANININNATVTAVTFNSEYADSDGMHSTSSNTSRITIVTPGWYTFVFNGEFAASAGGTDRSFNLRLNGSTYIGAARGAPIASATVTTLGVVTAMRSLSVGDYVEAVVYQNSGGALALRYSAAYSPTFSAVWHCP